MAFLLLLEKLPSAGVLWLFVKILTSHFSSHSMAVNSPPFHNWRSPASFSWGLWPEHFQDKVVGIGFRRRDQLNPDMLWSELGKFVLSNARFGLIDRLEVHLDDTSVVYVGTGAGLPPIFLSTNTIGNGLCSVSQRSIKLPPIRSLIW